MKAPKRKEVKTERIDKFQEVIHRKIKEKTLSNKIKSKKNTSRQRVKSNNSSRLSQL